jgi:formamidopyrimidine-DNA glycosylase
MPELPEVEVTRASLADRLAGQVVRMVRLGKTLRRPLGSEPASLVGLRAGTMIRRGKYLWLPLAGPHRSGGLLLHLGMSGSLAFGPNPGPRGPYDHFELVTDRGTLRLADPRRFGAVLWSGSLELPPAAPLLARLGREPFDPALTPQAFHAALRGRRAAIKQVLLAGDVVVGAGNIYACEALHAAGIDPRTRACQLSLPRAARLLAALRATLARAIEVGGSTLRDFRDAFGTVGEFQHEAAVYGRAGQPCPRCGGAIVRVVQGQRASYLCRGCQRR